MKKKILLLCLAVLLVLTAACGTKTSDFHVNLLKNGGFEEGEGLDVSSWSLDRYDGSDATENYGIEAKDGAPEGSNVLKIQCDTFNDARYTQTVAVEPNAYYKLSAKVKTAQISQRDSESGANLSFVQTYCHSDFISEKQDWQEVAVYGKTGSKVKSIDVCARIGFYSADCSGTAYFDDMRLEKIQKNEIPDGAFVGDITPFEFTQAEPADNEDGQPEQTKTEIEVTQLLWGILTLLLLVLFFLYAHTHRSAFGTIVFAVLLAIAFAVRVIAAKSYAGFKVDIGCFSAWAYRMRAEGLTGFYANDVFCDYPPLYMMVLGLLSLFSGGANLQEGWGLVLLKMPAILADIMGAIVLRQIAARHMGKERANILGILYAFLPVAILNSSLWGQVDSILVLFMLVTFDLIDNDKFGLSVITFVVGLLFKPQAVLFGPLMVGAAIREFTVIHYCRKKEEKKQRLIKGFGGFGIGVILFLLLSLVMKNDQPFGWLFRKYFDTLGSYNYATLSSFGFMGLIGGQWVDATQKSMFGISYSLLGTIFVVLVIAAAAWFYWLNASKNKKKKLCDTKFFWVLAAFVLAGVVTFSTRSHERYIFPVIAMLLAAFVQYQDVRLLIASAGYAVTSFVNTAVVLYLYEGTGRYMDGSEPMMRFGSLAAVALFAYLTYITATLCRERKTVPFHIEEAKTDHADAFMRRRSFCLPKVSWKDWAVCLVITAVYSVVAFTNLGDTHAPQTYWYTKTFNPEVVADLGQTQHLDGIDFMASSSGNFELSFSDDGENFTEPVSVEWGIGESRSWQPALEEGVDTRYVKLTAFSAVTLNGIALLQNGAPVVPAAVEQKVSPIDKGTTDPTALFESSETYGQELSYEKPQTFWTSEGAFSADFHEFINLDQVDVYIGEAAADAKLTLYTVDPASEEPTWHLVSTLTGAETDNGWVTLNLSGQEAFVYTDKIMIEKTGVMSVGEIYITDTDATVATLETATDLPLSEDVKQVFDEPQAWMSYDEQKGASTAAAWSVKGFSDFVLLDFGETKNIDRGYYYASVCNGNFSVYYSYDGLVWSTPDEITHDTGKLYYWRGLPGDGSTYSELNARYVCVCSDTPYLRLLEMGFFETADSTEVLPVTLVAASNTDEMGGACLVDEQQYVPESPTYMNSMYFDEIYHARTGYESAHQMSIYEWTHPPLGKDFIAMSISTLGMTPFAWRLPGTVAGILMLPVIYFIGLLMFRKRGWATLLELLLALDGMHFVQTRIATVDSFAVLFILLMFLFMYWYYCLSFYDVPLKKTLVPLGLCGLSFGLGAASKWIGLYAGAGLAVLFFITVGRRAYEYALAGKQLKYARGEERQYLVKVRNSFVPNLMITLLFCIGVFIIVPLIIYALAYIPYYRVTGESRPWYEIILSNQRDMFNYHSKLQATHSFQSDWYTWPVMYRPMWFYAGRVSDPQQVATISCFGNPAVWYAGLVCTVLGILTALKRHVTPVKFLPGDTKKPDGLLAFFGLQNNRGAAKVLDWFSAGEDGLQDAEERDNRLLLFLTVGVACNLLPWVGVNRCIFIYHYFATVPFIMMFTVYVLRHISRKQKGWALLLAALLAVLALVLFIMFKPIWTGTPVSREYVKTFLRWFSSWSFGV